MRFNSLHLFSLASILASVACSTGTAEPASTGDEAVTGVTDLGAVEAELALVKDVQDATGAWARSDATLRSGPCYKRTVGGPNGASYEYRRYRQGAAFFAKRGTEPMTGDKRPISCVDADITP